MYIQTEVVWNKKHCAMYVKWRFGMRRYPKPLRNGYNKLLNKAFADFSTF